MNEGWLYPAYVFNLQKHKIEGWSIGERMTKISDNDTVPDSTEQKRKEEF